MLVRISAFDIDVQSEKIDLDSLTLKMVELSGRQENNRFFYFDRESFAGFCVGVIITVKDQRKFCTLMQGEAGENVIKVNGLEENDQIMDFNFFVINLDNGIGVYQQYHHSAALSCLAKKISEDARSLKEELVEAKVAEERAQKKRELSASRLRRINKEHKTKIVTSPLVSRARLEEILRGYHKIKAMEYSYTTLEVNIREATPLGERVHKKREHISFVNPSLVAILSAEIAAAIEEFPFAKGKVFVEDAQGKNEIVRMFDIPEVLWEADYDTVVAMINNIDPADFANNTFLQDIVALFDHQDFSPILRAAV
ncbi:TPA: hypothetical protein ACXNEU_006085 [Pseudomonas aeruginosa]